MASTIEYLQYILEQTASLGEVTQRAMMGEYLLYYRGKLVGGLYDDRLLVKPTAGARSLLPTAPMQLPYEGTKPMLLVTETDDEALLAKVIAAVYLDLYGK